MQERALTVSGDGGVRLAARVFAGPGSDAPALLLHHGLASSQHVWDLMLPSLTRRYRVATFDARGHGQSQKPTSGFGFDHIVADALAVARAARLRRPVVVGHSWGAMATLELATAHDRTLAGAVLVDGGITRMADGMDWSTAKQRLAPPHLDGMPASEFRGMIGTFFADAVDVTPDVEAIVMSVMRVPPDGTIAPHLSRANHFRILRAIYDQDPLASIGMLRVPTLAIVARRGGDPDWDEAKRAAVRRVRRAAEGRPVTVRWMDGIHDLPLQHPNSLAARIDRFAASVVG